MYYAVMMVAGVWTPVEVLIEGETGRIGVDVSEDADDAGAIPLALLRAALKVEINDLVRAEDAEDAARERKEVVRLRLEEHSAQLLKDRRAAIALEMLREEAAA